MTLLALRPYAGLDGLFQKLEYRSSPIMPFKELPIDGDGIQFLVSMDDLRIIPRHEFKVAIDAALLKPHYDKHKPSLRLIVLTRDSMLRREIVLSSHALDDIPDVITLRPDDLRMTGHRDRLPLEFVVVAVPVIAGGPALPTQKASRLAEFHVTLLNSSGGASFPYRRKTAAELEERGLPVETGVHLECFGGVEELVKDTDTAPHALFEVWIHENVWDAIQNEGTGAASQLRILTVTETTAMLLLSAIIPAIKAGNQIEDGSVAGQLISLVEKRTGKNRGDLRTQFQQDLSLPALAPFVQATFRFATIAGKVDADDEAAE